MSDVISPTAVSPAVQVRSDTYLQWGAIIAGAVVASAVSFVLLSAGAAIGLSLLSPYAGQSYTGMAASLAVFWTIFAPILSLLIGGYIAGRLRAAWAGATIDEVEFRDGLHGLLVWATSVLIGGALAFLTAAGAAQLVASSSRSFDAPDQSALAPAVDYAFRPSFVAQVSTAPANPAGAAPATLLRPSRVLPLSDGLRGEVTRILTTAVAEGALARDDRVYLAQLVSDRTGLSPAEAEKRVDESFSKAGASVETARKLTVLAGLGTATALLLGLAAAWYAAQRGGRHRDANIPAKFRFAPRPLR